ncbi:hypothetical protein F889_01562 [Acinetobacter colistiniresistens]|uniref:Uncharacterized protein n=1 Tax=Acinetobacter colistiniresistens TaxID=280145 RepID=N9R6Z5_9GAMM|nr:hypothetical protein [Acinetobacter colistiniresistens]ENX34922.1 hypothetical protein F889_01562 [Acinetobacter colistiniresistens]
MNKYNWAEVPLEVEWIATDSDGTVVCFDREPKCRENLGIWTPIDPLNMALLDNQYAGDWKESLEKRPVGMSE